MKKDNQTAKYLLKTIELELVQSQSTGKTDNLTEWRKQYFKKTSEGDFVLKESEEELYEKWEALANIYEQYNLEMNKRGYYDFDDMIFVTGRALKKDIELRAEIAEQYQYIMIDEFQDTSEAQFNLIKEITNFENNNKDPNILAVGDDDQSIFKFQGAELDNITKFKKIFPQTKIITLDKNYRSTQNILDGARNLIKKISDRLEVRYPEEIKKDIRASNKELIKKYKGDIIEKNFKNDLQEKDYIAKEIQKLIEKGVKAEEITIIARNHKDLRDFSDILNNYQINHKYEKKENVFEKEPIREILTILDFVNGGLENIKEELLPEILAFPFWNISHIEVWKIAETIRNYQYKVNELGEKIYEKVSWLKIMLDGDNKQVKNIANFLINLITKSKNTPLLYLIDEIIGNHGYELYEEEESERVDQKNIARGVFISPFREYYFGKKNFQNKKSLYLDFLSALQTFIQALREYKPGETLYLKDLVSFVNIYKIDSNLTLSTVSLFQTGKEAITLQTAHKSKGLEYGYVFILNSSEESWKNNNFKNNIKFPLTLPLLPNSNNIDDNIRLYYVAMTRAKHTLYITYVKEKFSYLLNDSEEEKILKNTKGKEVSESFKESLDDNLLETFNPIKKREFQVDEKVILKNILENYQMPVTHLNNYLNLSRVGPEAFVEQNLLRFPQAINPSSAYGSAIHKALENYYKYIAKYNKKPTLETICFNFKNALQLQTLTEIDYQKYLEAGYKDLETFINFLESEEHLEIIETEVDFKRKGIVIDGVRLSGKIDRIERNKKEVRVVDYKTGRNFDNWEVKGQEDNQKIKLHFYQYQLAYYYILLENSKEYSSLDFQEARLEFVESDKDKKIKVLSLKKDKEFLELVERVKKLTKIIYNKILNLDFPDTSKYKLKKDGEEKGSFSLKNIMEFEDDLLSGRI